MYGDDPDPTVTIVLLGFGEVSDARKGSMKCAERLDIETRGEIEDNRV